jgi:hypothetical protein
VEELDGLLEVTEFLVSGSDSAKCLGNDFVIGS